MSPESAAIIGRSDTEFESIRAAFQVQMAMLLAIFDEQMTVIRKNADTYRCLAAPTCDVRK